MLLKVWKRNSLRKFFGPLEEESWRIQNNSEPNIVATIKEGRLPHLGHVQRMPDKRLYINEWQARKKETEGETEAKMVERSTANGSERIENKGSLLLVRSRAAVAVS